jgi:nitrogen-specific signal transduction histidine kinase/CheY-like chemotaxis protein
MPSPTSPLHRPSSGHARRLSEAEGSTIIETVQPTPIVPEQHEVGANAGHVPSSNSITKMSGSTAKSIDEPAGIDNKATAGGSGKKGASHRASNSLTEGQSAGRESPDDSDLAIHADLLGLEYDMKAKSESEIARLREAVNSQLLLSQQRDRLAKQMEESGRQELRSPNKMKTRSRVSPIHEEALSPSLDAAFASPVLPGPDTASTESAKTLRGSATPGFQARTPSYPFPPMKTPRQLSFNGHQPFTTLSPTVPPANFPSGIFDAPHDRLLSGSVTPASTLVFHPSGVAQSPSHPDFPNPNLYELTLQLSAEPGLDAWWTTVVQIMREVFKADRVTLAVPADSTDIENVPWGQKATFNAVEDDELSMSYLPRGSSLQPSVDNQTEVSTPEDFKHGGDSPPMLAPDSTLRPGIHRGHSFTSYEDTKNTPSQRSDSSKAAATRRPLLSRSKSHISAYPESVDRSRDSQPELNAQSLEEHLANQHGKTSAEWENPSGSAREVKGRMFSVLQALDYEADPLIDSSGVLRVLERGKVIALTRDYPYLDKPGDESSGSTGVAQQSTKPKEPVVEKSKKPELMSRITSFLGSKTSRRSTRTARSYPNEKGKTSSAARGYEEDELKPPTPRYEEYEQAPPSPWSQSPAPSPAVRSDPNENPFFANASIDEESFNPEPSPMDYSSMQPVETIGVDRSWTVLHIPLTHVLLSKPVHSFRLDAAAMESKSHKQTGSQQIPPQTIEAEREKKTPIAILSILSPIIPYPSNLRHGLEFLAPHLATSFSLCRHFTNLETEVAGLSRKRPQTSGFGAVATAQRSGNDRVNIGNLSQLPRDEEGPSQSNGGSITSPSDYSGVSRSNAGSPAITPGWDPGSVGLSMERRSAGGSPSYVPNDSYFSSKSKAHNQRFETSSVTGITGARRSSKESKDSSPNDIRQQARGETDDKVLLDAVASNVGAGYQEDTDSAKRDNEQTGDDAAATLAVKHEVRFRSDPQSHDMPISTPEARDPSPSRPSDSLPLSPRRQAMRGASSQSINRVERPHTQLHSYGADFASTFQSLPTTTVSTPGKAPGAPRGHTRNGSATSGPVDMPPPSDRLKGLMLDSLPAHVFVALPQTGEIVWVNNRYLTYRGQTVGDLFRDPWSSIHPEERDEYLKAWSHALRTGEQFSMQVRIRRFDGNYRWFYTRAVGSRDTRGVIVQWYGSHMDIHDQHIAEVKAARQEEIEASEAKHRLLANLIPQIIFAATEDEGVTFANEQWLSYTGQEFDDALGLGFMDFVHPDDLAKCRIPTDRPPTPTQRSKKPSRPTRHPSQSSSGGKSSSASTASSIISNAPTETTVKGIHQTLSRQNSSSSGSVYELPTADLSELARSGVIKVTTDSNGRLSYTTEVRLRSKTGEYRWHLVRCVEVDNINFGSGDGSWFGACTDINDHKLLETKLKEAMESKSKFLSNMSHEIRTPLIGISGMVSFLQDTVLNEEQLDYTNTIQTSANGLLMIINDILDLSKVDAGMMKLSYEWFHTRSLIEDVNELVSTMAISKRLELNYVVDEDVPAMVKGDKVRIRQVLLNVIGNAIKFTSEGEVFSRCRVYLNESEMIGENEIMLEYSIVDTGRGFTKEEGELIFKPFSQIDGSSTRQHGGSGLGLVISRQLVELHGGKMEGSAEPGKGSTFTFTARFGLPTSLDHPEPPLTPAVNNKSSAAPSTFSHEVSARAMKQAGGNPILANKLIQSPSTLSPQTDQGLGSPAVNSSASSDPSIRSMRTHVTDRSSVSSNKSGLTHFSEAARASGQDLSSMKLALPERSSPNLTPVQIVPKPIRHGSNSSGELKHFRPPMYSILVICPQTHSREATTQHIEMTLPKDIPHQITPLASVVESQKLIGGEDPVIFTHIVLNLSSPEEIIALMDQIFGSVQLPQTSIVILSDPVQRQAVMKLASDYDYDQLAKDSRVSFIYKPVKPSRFAVIFDPEKERDLSTDRNRSSAQQQVLNQKQNYLDVEKRLGNKGYKVLLVEDNAVNQKVLLKFLSKVGIEVEIALDGVECTEKVFSKTHDYYSLILVRHLFVPFMSCTLTPMTVRSTYAPQRRLSNVHGHSRVRECT